MGGASQTRSTASLLLGKRHLCRDSALQRAPRPTTGAGCVLQGPQQRQEQFLPQNHRFWGVWGLRRAARAGGRHKGQPRGRVLARALPGGAGTPPPVPLEPPRSLPEAPPAAPRSLTRCPPARLHSLRSVPPAHWLPPSAAPLPANRRRAYWSRPAPPCRKRVGSPSRGTGGGGAGGGGSPPPREPNGQRGASAAAVSARPRSPAPEPRGG